MQRESGGGAEMGRGEEPLVSYAVREMAGRES